MRIATKIILVVAILAAVAAAVVVAATPEGNGRIYAISGSSSGYMMWNANEAYYFINVSHLGYSWSAPEYSWVLFKRYVIGGFAAAEFPTDQRGELAVMRATASGVERHVLKLASRFDGGQGSDPDQFTPLEGRIYAYCPTVIGTRLQKGQRIGNDMDHALCWWNGNHFERATDEERRRLNGIKSLTKEDFENDNNGWSRRTFGAELVDRKSTIDVGGKFQLLMTNVALDSQRGIASIKLLRPGKAPERLGEFQKYEAASVNRDEYQRVFGEGK